jgi:hypothetical protein
MIIQYESLANEAAGIAEFIKNLITNRGYRPQEILVLAQRVDTEVRRLKALSEAKYGPEALATAKRWGRPVGIIHHLTGRKPGLSAGTYRTRRMRARKRGQRMPIGQTWEQHAQGGKYFGRNGKVLTARLQIGGRVWRWPLKGIDDEKAEALMEPVRVAREHLHRAAGGRSSALLARVNCFAVA